MARIVAFAVAMAVTITLNAQSSSSARHFAFRLPPHADLKQSIIKFATDNGIKAGALLTCVGSLEEYHLRFANQEKGTIGKGHFEIVSLTGTFNSLSSHIHMSISDEKGQTIGGHLMDGNLIYTTAEIVVIELTDLEFVRETDATYGYPELVVKKKNP